MISCDNETVNKNSGGNWSFISMLLMMDLASKQREIDEDDSTVHDIEDGVGDS